jgi:hypothetical protein
MDQLLDELNEVLERYDSDIEQFRDLIIQWKDDANPLFAACEIISPDPGDEIDWVYEQMKDERMGDLE